MAIEVAERCRQTVTAVPSGKGVKAGRCRKVQDHVRAHLDELGSDLAQFLAFVGVEVWICVRSLAQFFCERYPLLGNHLRAIGRPPRQSILGGCRWGQVGNALALSIVSTAIVAQRVLGMLSMGDRPRCACQGMSCCPSMLSFAGGED
jgi:hypothetical protein